MTSPEKPDPAFAWLFVEKLLADEELERLAKLPDEELDAELDGLLRAKGIDPGSVRVPSYEELMAGVERRQAALEREKAKGRS